SPSPESPISQGYKTEDGRRKKEEGKKKDKESRENVNVAKRARVLQLFHPAVAEWFSASFDAPTPPQTEGWPAIARAESTLILAPTGSGKTLTAFLWAINRVMHGEVPPERQRCRIIY